MTLETLYSPLVHQLVLSVLALTAVALLCTWLGIWCVFHAINDLKDEIRKLKP